MKRKDYSHRIASIGLMAAARFAGITAASMERKNEAQPTAIKSYT